MRSQEDDDDYGSRPPLLIMPIQTGSSSDALGAYPGLIRNNSLIQSCDGEHGQGSTNEENKGMVRPILLLSIVLVKKHTIRTFPSEDKPKSTSVRSN